MSTQDGCVIPFEICIEQQRLRLLELPHSFLELITTRGLSHLTLKSTPFSPLDDSTQAPANAVLCTDNQTFQVRQVQSSNSVFVLQPSENSLASRTDANPSVALSAIAKCAATLELVPTPPSAIATLKRMLPVYTGSESVLALGYLEKTSKETILGNVPFSRGEIDEAWKELCAFEFEGRAWIPAAPPLNGIWNSVISAATLRGVDLGNGFPMTALEGVVEEDGHPIVLFRAVIDRLSSEEKNLMDGYAILDREKTLPWVGAVLLKSQGDLAEGISLSDFVQDWQNHLPEDWREHAKIDVLKGKYSLPLRDRIAFEEGANEASDSKEPATAIASGKVARKWHDKFRDARR